MSNVGTYPIIPVNGGTGVANPNPYTITLSGAVNLSGALTTTGANSLDFTTTGATSLTLPTSGTLLSVSSPGSALLVSQGGTGDTSLTAYAPLCGGTTTTGAVQSASSGQSTSGSVLTSTGASSLPIWGNVSGTFTWLAVSSPGFPFALMKGSGYLCASSSTYTLQLPVFPSQVGDVIAVSLAGTATSWQIVQTLQPGQQIQIGNQTTTLGTGGSLSSTALGDTVTLVCVNPGLKWVVISSIGNITVV